MAGRLSAAARAELERRQARAVAAFTPETIAGGHAAQLEMIQWVLDPSAVRYGIAMCSRRAGKTTGICGALASLALLAPGVNLLYVILTATQAENAVWRRIWQPMLRDHGLGAPLVRHTEDDLTTFFPGDSQVRFVGSDDVRYIASLLGDRYDLVVIDECQDQADAVLSPLVMDILPPALSDTGGKLLMTGTVPAVPGGFFYRTWEAARYRRFAWSRFSNPHLKDQEKRLREHLEANPQLTEHSPQIRRAWYGEAVWGDDPYRGYDYQAERNGYKPVVPEWAQLLEVPSGKVWASEPKLHVDTFACAIDPGSRDRTSVQVLGWGERFAGVQHVFDWTSERNARLSWGQIAPVLAVIQQRFRPVRWYYDAGSSQQELDTFYRDYGVPVIKAANKADLKGQVARMSDLLARRRMWIMKGSPLEDDLIKARWQPDARNRGLYSWSSTHHPDASEAARYTLAAYYDLFQAPTNQTDEQREQEREAAELTALYQRPVAGNEWRDPDLERFAGG